MLLGRHYTRLSSTVVSKEFWHGRNSQLPPLSSPTITPIHINWSQQETKIPRYTPFIDIPTADDKILEAAGVVRSAVQGVTKQGYEWPGNYDTKCSGSQIKNSGLKQGKADQPIFLDPGLELCKMTPWANVRLVDARVEWTALWYKSILSFQEKGCSCLGKQVKRDDFFFFNRLVVWWQFSIVGVTVPKLLGHDSTINQHGYFKCILEWQLVHPDVIPMSSQFQSIRGATLSWP